MIKKNRKNKKEQPEITIIEELIKEVREKRDSEAEEILKLMKDYPGSTFEEMVMLSGYCGNCCTRRMAWLKVNGKIKFDGEYYWPEPEKAKVG